MLVTSEILMSPICVFYFCYKYQCLLTMQNIVADMRKVLAKNPQVEQQKLHRRVFLENVNPENQALMVGLQSTLHLSTY